MNGGRSVLNRSADCPNPPPGPTHIHADIHLDLTAIPHKTLKGAVTLAFCCRQPATGAGDPPLRKAMLDAVAFSEVEVSEVFDVAHRVVRLLGGGWVESKDPS